MTSSGSSAERLLTDSKPKSESGRDAPAGLWSDAPSKKRDAEPKRRSIAATPPPLPKSKLPPRNLPPPVPRHRPANMKLVVPPEAEQTKVTKRKALPNPEDVSAEEAFHVDPAPEEERAQATPPPLPKPPSIPTEAKAAPAPLKPDEPSQERELPRLLLSSHPPPPPDDSGLRSPFDTPESVAPPPAASGFDVKSASVGFAVGAILVAIIAFVLWPRPEAPVADVTPAGDEPRTTDVDEPATPEPEPVRLAQDEPVEDDVASDEATEDEDQAAADAQEADEPPRVERRAAAPAGRRAPRRGQVARDERSLPELRDEPPRTQPTVVERPSGPAIAAETTPPPRARPSDLPATPTRQDVANAITSIRGQLLECAPEHRGHVANIRFTFVSSGRATSALVPNDFATPQARSCVARVSRQARVPAFSDPRLVVTYPVTF